ncbi:hypothetical protein [Streptomyces sp. NPDC059649]|uniref:hypothetical protein n=1 Tax=Streptomyces sp. NPDC059649 TaxID=3346895 RepID=UPI0036B5FAF0
MRSRHVLQLVTVPLAAVLLTLGSASAASAVGSTHIGIGAGAGFTSIVSAVLGLGLG